MRRRSFLALSAAALATPAWSATTARFVTAASRPDKSTWLVGLSDSAEVLFQIPIPSRGHAAATHPLQAQAVAFARRPGRFAVILDCLSGRETARLSAPEGRHFYGHGAFTTDGRYLLTTENDYDGPDGRIGIWDATAGYRRVDEVPSGGDRSARNPAPARWRFCRGQRRYPDPPGFPARQAEPANHAAQSDLP
ncbi:DUF1513 domain-containing protein [Meridianimarinicoccus sp. MJW13]|uniref:DUF1513 domain-containing protein n=1 Tax=Meridianimarinicoccus sp. MJW13 TaxID=2720031 RepID=UPI0018680F6C|nr:DUF1513 domain-containing protein [Fluviibacterium sp. MJW13]